MRKVKLISAISTLVVMISSAIFAVIYFVKQDVQAKVVTTIFPIYDICREILGDSDDLVLLESNGSDMHSYQPTATDIATISSAELFIFIGGESDKWVGEVIRSSGSVNLKSLALMENVNKVEESHEGIIDEGHEHEHEHEEVVYDEHIWLSVKNVIKMIDAIEESLITVFPERQKLIEDNAEEYREKWIDLEIEYASAMSNKTRTLIVADRFPFRYLVEDYDVNYYAVFSGCSTESNADMATMTTLINKINEYDVNYILQLENSSNDIAESAKNNPNCKSVEILTINSCQSILRKNIENISFLDIIENNLENFKKALDI